MVISAAEDADLMDPASWTATAPLPFDAAWTAGLQPQLPIAGYLEGGRARRKDTQNSSQARSRWGLDSPRPKFITASRASDGRRRLMPLPQSLCKLPDAKQSCTQKPQDSSMDTCRQFDPLRS